MKNILHTVFVVTIDTCPSGYRVDSIHTTLASAEKTVAFLTTNLVCGSPLVTPDEVSITHWSVNMGEN